LGGAGGFVGERWLAHPAALKTLGDWAYCEGINRLVFHRYAHQPWPGSRAGMNWKRRRR
jgi:hypothetical protein